MAARKIPARYEIIFHAAIAALRGKWHTTLMTARPDSPLDQQRQIVADLRARIAREELILEGMERMAAFIPSRPNAARPKSSARVSVSGSRGRQPGAISKRWREVFRALVASGNGFNDDAVVHMVKRLEGRDMRKSEVRRLFENHRANGLVEIHDDGTYSVTQHAVEKFDLGENAHDRNENGEAEASPDVSEVPASRYQYEDGNDLI